jgi:hypothetical protein
LYFYLQGGLVFRYALKSDIRKYLIRPLEDDVTETIVTSPNNLGTEHLGLSLGYTISYPLAQHHWLELNLRYNNYFIQNFKQNFYQDGFRIGITYGIGK